MMAKATTQSVVRIAAGFFGRPAWNGQDHYRHTHPAPLDWRQRMSDTVAYALLAYTGLQIAVMMQAIANGTTSMLPVFALAMLVSAIIPLFRRYERQWQLLDDAAAADPSRRPLFRRDQLSVWLLAIGLPFALTGLFRMAGTLLG
jgi:hypothetical protein